MEIEPTMDPTTLEHPGWIVPTMALSGTVIITVICVLFLTTCWDRRRDKKFLRLQRELDDIKTGFQPPEPEGTPPISCLEEPAVRNNLRISEPIYDNRNPFDSFEDDSDEGIIPRHNPGRVKRVVSAHVGSSVDLGAGDLSPLIPGVNDLEQDSSTMPDELLGNNHGQICRV